MRVNVVNGPVYNRAKLWVASYAFNAPLPPRKHNFLLASHNARKWIVVVTLYRPVVAVPLLFSQ